MKKLSYLMLMVVASIAFIIACSDAIELYEVTFESQGGNSPSLTKAAKEAMVEEPTPPNREGYTFG